MPIYSLKAHMLRIKQTIGLDFSTALSTSPSPILFCHSAEFFMKFRGPQALYNRPQKTMVRPTKNHMQTNFGESALRHTE